MALVMMSIFFVYGFGVSTIALLCIIFLFVLFSIVVCVLSLFLKHSFFKTYPKHLLLFLIAFCLMTGYGYGVFHKMQLSNHFEEKVIVVGKIDEVVSGENYKRIYLKDIKVVEQSGKVTQLSYQASMYVYGTQEIYKQGMVGAYEGYLNKLSIPNHFDSWVKGVGYQLDGSLSSSYRVEGSWSYEFKEYVRGLLENNMTPDLAGLCYGSLFGDKSFVESETKQAFTGSGLGHMLAVSGLHITLFVGILTFILKKTKMPKYLRFVIVFAFLLLYCHICGYSASCVRASIMSLVVLFGYIVGWPYDSLSSLGLAGSIILLIQPMQLFTLGFQLSFVAILSIVTLSPTLEKLLLKCKVPKKVAQALAVTLAVNIGMIAVMIAHFEKVYILAILVNLIAIPLFQVAYILLVFCVLFTLICPYIQAVLILPAILFHMVKSLAVFFASIPYASVTIFNIGLFTTLFLISGAFILKYYMCRLSLKYVLTTTLFALMFVSLVIENIPAKVSNNCITIIGQSNSVILEDKSTQSRIVIGQGNFTQNKVLWDYIKKEKAYRIDSLLYFDFTYKDVQYIDSYVQKYHTSNFYVNNSKATSISNKVNYTTQIQVGTWRISPYAIENKGIGYTFMTPTLKIAILDTPLKSQWESIEKENFDMIVIEQLNFAIPPNTQTQYYVKGGRAERQKEINYITTDVIKVGI